MGLADDRAAFLAGRKAGIGGSDVAPIFGLSKWKSPAQVWAEKRGDVPEDDRQKMFLLLGNALEPYIAEMYEEQTGTKTRASHKQFVHPKFPHLFANVDRRARGKIVEFKTSRVPDDWGLPGTSDVPTQYRLQVEHYMCVTGAKKADIAVLWMNRAYPELSVYHIDADPALQVKLTERLNNFWQLVQDGIPPAPICVDDAVAQWRNADGTEVIADDETLEAWNEYHEIKEQIALLEERQDTLKLRIMEAMKTASYLRRGHKVLATWRNQKDSKRIDAAKLRTRHPAIAEECSYVIPGPRPLRIQSNERSG